MRKTHFDKPWAIILCREITGLATVRGIAQTDARVIAVTFSYHRQPVFFSRFCHNINLPDLKCDEDGMIRWLLQYAQNINNRPVLIPTSDVHALLLSKHFKTLSPFYLLWTTNYLDLLRIVNKNGLYDIARTSGIETVPSICEPDMEQVQTWSSSYNGPYFLKPFYNNIPSCALDTQNLVIPSRQELLNYVRKNGTGSLIIQQMILGGDGYVFDCYGLTNKNGTVLTMASHRRLRMFRTGRGATSFGEIPSKPDGYDESILFEKTVKLLKSVRYHGIFGIEWLQDRMTGKIYLIDFNARPFTSIGHLSSCGLNLPGLAYRELTSDNLSDVEYIPKLRHKYWVDFWKDMDTARRKCSSNELTWIDWLKTLFICRSFAYWDIRDPGPWLFRLFQMLNKFLRYVSSKFF